MRDGADRGWWAIGSIILLGIASYVAVWLRHPLSPPVPAPTPAATATLNPEPTATPSPTPEAHVVPQIAFEGALVSRGWPRWEAARLAEAVATCEAPAYDRFGESVGIDLSLRGDDGLAWGPGIRIDYHPGIEQRYDLTTLSGAADGASEIRRAALAAGIEPLSLWHCVR